MKLFAYSIVIPLMVVCAAVCSCCGQTDGGRPVIHFSSEAGWAGEPVSLIYDEGTYHLYYLSDSSGDFSSGMSWGHAVSQNLLRWNHAPAAVSAGVVPALSSGCVVVDSLMSSGFSSDTLNTHPFVAFHTSSDSQLSAMVSYDGGYQWSQPDVQIELSGCPERNIHSPSVIWDREAHRWIMVMTSRSSALFFSSTDLIHWEFSGEFEDLTTPTPHTWESSRLLCLPESSDTGLSWVLMVNMDGSPSGASGVRYYVGDFDGSSFTPSQKKELWMDYGLDCSCGTACDTPSGWIWMAWMNDWEYALSLPSDGWSGCMTLPRKLTMNKEGRVRTLTSLPAADYSSSLHQLSALNETVLRKDEVRSMYFKGGFPLEITAAFDNRDRFAIDKAFEFGVRLSTRHGQTLTVAYSHELGCYYMDRGGVSCQAIQDPHFSLAGATIRSADSLLDMRIVIDRCSAELFASSGKVNITSQIYPEDPFCRADFYALEGKATLTGASVSVIKTENNRQK